MHSHLLPWLAPIGAAILVFGKVLANFLGRSRTPAAAPEVPPPPEPATVLPAPKAVVPDGLTPQGLAELIFHESICLEAYKDVMKVWTWGIGVTDASGHLVERYIDHPAPLSECLQIFLWLVRQKYLPEVLKEFEGHPLTETQLAAALSFHYNTGAIGHASWVTLWKTGYPSGARAAFMEWDKPASILLRRTQERNLFFDGKWAGDGTTMVYPVLKPSYQPDFAHGVRLYVLEPLKQIMDQ